MAGPIRKEKLDNMLDFAAKNPARELLEDGTEDVEAQPDPMGGEYPALSEQKPKAPVMPESMTVDEDDDDDEGEGLDEDPYADDEEEDEPEERRRAMRALYGEDFPLANDSMEEPRNEDWANWSKGLWTNLAGGVERYMHGVWRNRLFRKGMQWLSATGTGPWRNPPKPRDAVRAVHNLVAPALDQRIQILTEQRPGFRASPVTQDPDDMKKAEGQQVALEYQYHNQNMQAIVREAAYWAGTDGVAFMMCYWDPDAGPWHEGTDAKGKPYKAPLGDVRTRVYRAENVRVSPNATATRKPNYWVVREIMPLSEAIALYGDDVVKENATPGDRVNDESMLGQSTRLGLELPGLDELYQDQDVVDRYYVFCEPTEYLPDGLMVVTVGDKTLFAGSLIAGVVPMIRFTDGTTDPAFFPQAIMADWLDHQVRINMLVSKWIESIRVNSGGRFFMKPNAVSNETLIGGLVSAIEVRSAGSVKDAVVPFEGFSVGQDIMNAIEFEIKAFEQKSGSNDATRGGFSNQQSGRAILAIREQLERAFAPVVNSASEAMTEWGRINLQFMKWGYDIPRTIGVTGMSRPDLAREMGSDDFDGVCDVFIDPETLMPMPRALRLFLLDQMYDKQQITAQEYRRRIPFAWVRNIGTPDEVHEARARRVAEAIRSRKEVPALLWQDDEAIHQDVLDREIILNDSLPADVRQVAQERWKALADQAGLKSGAIPPPGSAGPTSGGPPPEGESLPPGDQPFLGTNPGVASAPIRDLTGTQEDSALLGRIGPDRTNLI